jgi:hypothetical protein
MNITINFFLLYLPYVPIIMQFDPETPYFSPAEIKPKEVVQNPCYSFPVNLRHVEHTLIKANHRYCYQLSIPR